jgi:hypothetical protein
MTELIITIIFSIVLQLLLSYEMFSENSFQFFYVFQLLTIGVKTWERSIKINIK